MVRDGAKNGRWNGGASAHPLYLIWHDIRSRCRNPNHARWSSYGGRGITMDDRWHDDFWAFVEGVGERPAGRLASGRPAWTLDRIDNDGPYAPGNVRWASYSTQARNRRDLAYAGSVRNPETGRFL